jgi:hypothetical protein
MSITITDEMVDVAMAAGLGPRSPFVFDPVYVGFDLRAALSAAAPLIEAAVRERCAQVVDDIADQTDAGLLVSSTARYIAAAIRADGGAE